MKRFFRRRSALLFAAGCAGVLAAGMAAVAAAGRFAPGRQVSARAALPVYSALGAAGADVLFWPEEVWEEYSLAGTARQQENTGKVQLFAGPWLSMAGWNAYESGGLPGTFWRVPARGGECFYARDVRFARPLPGTGEPLRALMAQVGAGRREDGFAVSCRVWADDGYRDLPDDWQETAVQRCREEVYGLLNLWDDEGRAGLYHFLETLFSRRQLRGGGRFDDPEMELYWQEEGVWQMDGVLSELAALLRAGKTDAMQKFYRISWQPPEGDFEGLYPREGLAADADFTDEELAALLMGQGLEVQLVPMEQQVMVLFSWAGGDLAVYYDPVLGCFSGYSLQY